MKYNVVNKEDKSYIMFNEIESKIHSEADMLDIISACFESGINSVMIDGRIIADEFYDLKTKLFGMFLQKIINYKIKVVFIINEERTMNDRFKELALELNKGTDIRFYNNAEDAQEWLLK